MSGRGRPSITSIIDKSRTLVPVAVKVLRDNRGRLGSNTLIRLVLDEPKAQKIAYKEYYLPYLKEALVNSGLVTVGKGRGGVIILRDNSNEKLDERFLALLEEGGGKLGNKTLQDLMQNDSDARMHGYTLDTFWTIKSRLLEQGKVSSGKGKGGSTILGTPQDESEMDPEEQAEEELEYQKESELYEPVEKNLSSKWAVDMEMTDVAVQQTAYRGRTHTGGKWSRPDITLVHFREFDYSPNIYELVTIEIKAKDCLDVTAIFESLSHLRCGMYAYVWAHADVKENGQWDIESRVLDEAKRQGIGLIAASDPADYETWETLVDAVRHTPDPSDIDSFVDKQFSNELKEKIVQHIS